MRWLADECVAVSLVAFLRTKGHDVLYVAEAAAGLSDADLIALALHEKRLLLTEDKDFGDLVFRRERTVPGVVLMRIGSENPELKSTRLAAAIERFGEGLFGRYMVRKDASGRVICGVRGRTAVVGRNSVAYSPFSDDAISSGQPISRDFGPVFFCLISRSAWIFPTARANPRVVATK